MDGELRRPGSILKEMDRLHELIDENRRLIEEHPYEFALQLSLMSFENREKALLEELDKSYKSILIDTFDLDIAGDSVDYHRISSSVLGKILLDLQRVISSIAHSITDKASAISGPIPYDIIRASRIDTVATCGGSFKIVLTSNQPALGESLTKTSFRRFNRLLDSEDSKELIRGEIQDLGPRAINRYKELLDTIYKSNSRIKLYDVIKPEGFETKIITSEMAKRIYDKITNEEAIPDREERYSGTIKGLSLLKYTFQFLVDGSADIISGNFNPKLSEKVKNSLDKHTVAVFKITTKQNEITEELDKNYHLLGFKE
jgi:hypothetical protein